MSAVIQIPIFPLPDEVLFPHKSMLPLHIFEPRYRQMAQDCLAGDKRLAMGLLKPGWEKAYYGRPPIHAIAGAGEIVQGLRGAACTWMSHAGRRFVSGVSARGVLASCSLRKELAAGQEPFVIILGCSDSRVPAEMVFDQGLGDLFVIRVAGNIVASSQVGSVEFAAERFSTPLAVVLGHSRCGAVLATLEELMRPKANQARGLRSIVDRVRPSVEPLLATELSHNLEALVGHAVRANVRASANHLRHGSEVLEQLIENDRLVVVGAEYSLETGVVEFFDGVPLAA